MCYKLQVGGASEDLFLLRRRPPTDHGPVLLQETQVIKFGRNMGDGSELIALSVGELLHMSLKKLKNLRTNFDNAVEHEIERNIKEIVRNLLMENDEENNEVLSIKDIVRRVSTSCSDVQKDLESYLRLTAEKMKIKEIADEERIKRIQETFERKKKEMAEKEEALNQVEQNLEKEKEKTASLSKELAVLKKERSNFYATRARNENSMQEWMLVKELNDKLDKEKDALKLLKEDVLAKNETVSNLEGLWRF